MTGPIVPEPARPEVGVSTTGSWAYGPRDLYGGCSVADGDRNNTALTAGRNDGED